MLYDLHAALNLPGDPRLKPMTRMLRHLPFYEKTGQHLDQLQLLKTTPSQQINKLLRSLDRLYRLRNRKISDEKRQYIAERRQSVRLVKR